MEVENAFRFEGKLKPLLNMALASLTGSRSWILSIFITDLQMQKNIEVNGQTHVGQVMLDLVDKLGKT